MTRKTKRSRRRMNLGDKLLVATLTGVLAFQGIKYIANVQTKKPEESQKIERKVDGVEKIERKVKRNLEKKEVIVLDPGHGTSNRREGVYDPGAVAENFYEAKISLNQAKKIKGLLEEEGYDVYLTREDSNSPAPLDSRTKLAEKLNADIFVSLHCNAAENGDAYGQEVYHGENKASRLLAQYIQSGLIKEISKTSKFKTKNRGIKKANFRVLKTEVPAVLVESGFLTNQNDREYLTDEINDVEKAIADAIHAYLLDKEN